MFIKKLEIELLVLYLISANFDDLYLKKVTIT